MVGDPVDETVLEFQLHVITQLDILKAQNQQILSKQNREVTPNSERASINWKFDQISTMEEFDQLEQNLNDEGYRKNMVFNSI